MVEIDARLEARRQQVAEAHARSYLSRLIWILAMAAFLGASVWLARSPLLALTTVEVEGMAAPEVKDVLIESGLVVGRPMVLLRTGEIEQALLADPRIAAAEVILDWPQGATVYLVRRQPVAWVRYRDGWAQVAGDGTVLLEAASIDSTLPVVELSMSSSPPSAEVLGALAFVSELAPPSGAGVEVRLQGNELWASVAGVEVRLGRPIDMEAKAKALVALFAQDIPPEATINLLAPTRPAIAYPEETEG